MARRRLRRPPDPITDLMPVEVNLAKKPVVDKKQVQTPQQGNEALPQPPGQTGGRSVLPSALFLATALTLFFGQLPHQEIALPFLQDAKIEPRAANTVFAQAYLPPDSPPLGERTYRL
jgi:hypothetical protein